METGFHAILDTNVIHVHPIYPTLILCMDNSQDIIQEIYGDLNYKYVKYTSPGLPLSKSIRFLEKADIYFLENHGVVLSSIDLLYKIHNTAKQYIIDNCKCYEEFDINFSERKAEHHYAFPDAVIFANDITKRETIAAHNYINTIGTSLGKIRHLNSHQIQHLQNLEAEKYRKNA
jgi:rhamnose utilization protein RhaD (predicted bifunctional aldolase and dehydrogenase)